MPSFGYIERVREQLHEIEGAVHKQFWDVYQNYGKRTDYENAFYGEGWTPVTYNPHYELRDIECADAMYMYSRVTDVSLSLSEDCDAINSTFNACKQLVSVDLKFAVLYDAPYVFTGCSKIEHMNLDGVLCCDFSARWSYKLTEDSLRSIVNALADLYETGEEFEYKLTLSDDSMNILLNANLLDVLDEKGWNY